jgi:hypothetical protein
MSHFRTRGAARQLCERSCRRKLVAIRVAKLIRPVDTPGQRASSTGQRDLWH